MQYLRKSSAKSILSSKSAKAVSGSIIQNSDRCLDVLEFSALNVGPKVYTFPRASAPSSASSCPETVRLVCFPKKSFEKSILFILFFGILFKSRFVTWNISPAPSASAPVIIGV